MQNKIKTTKRKFYNKWTHKISLNIKEAWRFHRSQPLSGDLLDLDSFLDENFESSLYSIRVEDSIFDIYTNDINLHASMLKRFHGFLRSTSVPESDVLADLGQHDILSKSYPHGKFQFKVFLTPHKLTMDEKLNFLGWISKQSDGFLISDAVSNWFIKMVYNYDRRYMYVLDEKTLLMIKLKMPEALGTVYRYVLT